jgi:hypothetical protein
MRDIIGSRSIVLPTCAAAALIVGLALFVHDSPKSGWQHAARWTADFSVVLFLGTFVPKPSCLVAPIDRRGRVLGFVAAHLIHAAVFVTYHLLTIAPATSTMVLGGLGYVLIGCMVLIPPMSAPKLHRFGLWYVWLVFLATFATGLAAGDRQLGAATGTAAFVGAAIARLARARTAAGRRKA